MQPTKNFSKPLTIAGIVVVIAGIFGFTTLNKKDVNTTTATSTPSTDTTSTTTPSTAETNKYKDGTYTAQGNYISPGGAETVGVTLTIKGDKIVDSNFEMQADRPISVKLQGEFAAGYKQYVIGKNVDEVNVGKVSGSSLTPKGFNDAVAKIKIEAKS